MLFLLFFYTNEDLYLKLCFVAHNCHAQQAFELVMFLALEVDFNELFEACQLKWAYALA